MKRLVSLLLMGLALGAAVAGNAQTPRADAIVVSGKAADDRLAEELDRLQESIDSVIRAASVRSVGRGQLSEKIDSVQQSVNGLVYSIHNKTEEIKQNTHFGTKEWVGWWVALLSMVFAAITYRAQNKTEKHTQNAPISAQIGQFKDLTRHLYRNLVCTSAAIARYNVKENRLPDHSEKDTKREAYPSESNFNKLKTMPEDVILNIDVNERTYAAMHELRVLLRNYNEEIDVARNHISNAIVWNKAIEQDFDNLLFKPLFLMEKTFKPESLLLSVDSGPASLPDRCMQIIIQEHFEKLRANFDTLGKKRSQELLTLFFSPLPSGDVDSDRWRAVAENAGKNYMDLVGMGVERAVKNLFRSGCDNYGASFIAKIMNTNNDSNDDNVRYESRVAKEAFCHYLDLLSADECADLKRSIARNKHLLCMERLTLRWLFERDRYENKVGMLRSSLEILEKQLDKKQPDNKKQPDKQKEKGSKLGGFVRSLSGVSGFQQFEALHLVGYRSDDPEYVPHERLYESLKPYIAFISQANWDFREFLYIMLAIDTSIEVNRIGMVNYE